MVIKKIFKKINKFIRVGLNLLLKVFLGIVYFILLFPFAIVIRMRTDFLEIKRNSPYWIPYKKIENVGDFLKKQ